MSIFSASSDEILLAVILLFFTSIPICPLYNLSSTVISQFMPIIHLVTSTSNCQ
ncbi:MAG: hypothetical protein LBQ24_05045 [Candidatus Peribacteria bacterium]|nr:hypothetical protein [Candidatus Peribacteria bacterium]